MLSSLKASICHQLNQNHGTNKTVAQHIDITYLNNRKAKATMKTLLDNKNVPTLACASFELED